MTMQMSMFIDYLFQITRIQKGNEFMTITNWNVNMNIEVATEAHDRGGGGGGGGGQ